VNPTRLKRVENELHIDWSDGIRTKVSWQSLRKNCPCAACGEERNRKPDPFRVLSAKELAAGTPAPMAMQPVGHYAYQITWNDGHGAGIYTIESLRQLSEVVKDS
jgi:DUF971 family protein